MRTGRIIGLVAVISIVVFSLAPLASAQHLMPDAAWFKLKVSVKGFTYSTNSSPFEPFSYSATHYLRVSPTINAYEHNWQMWSINPNTGTWEISTNTTQPMIGKGDGLVHEWGTTWYWGQAMLGAVISGTMKIKLDGTSTKSAKFTSTGCTVSGFTGAGVYPYYSAGCKVKGTKVDPSKLPFSP